MKLFSKDKSASTPPGPSPAGNVISSPVERSAEQARPETYPKTEEWATHRDGDVWGGPVPRIVAVTPLTWKQASLPVSKVRINDGIRAWMRHDQGIANWINTALAAFLTLPNCLSYTCPVPDQYREDMGSDAIHFEHIRPGEVRVLA
jgi:hypothetical protein